MLVFGIVNPKAFTVSHLVTHKQAWPQASHQLNPALLHAAIMLKRTNKNMKISLIIIYFAFISFLHHTVYFYQNIEISKTKQKQPSAIT